MKSLFSRKLIAELLAEEGHPNSLKRELGASDLIMLAIGAVIGAGIFSSIGTAAAGEILPSGVVVRYGAGPALVVSFILLGAVCGLAALCYAELASMIPQAGSAYAYSYATLGEIVAWIIGWDLILEYAVGNVAVAVAWSGYFTSFLTAFGVEFPGWATHGYRAVSLSSDPAVQGLMQTAPRIGGIPVLVNIPAGSRSSAAVQGSVRMAGDAGRGGLLPVYNDRVAGSRMGTVRDLAGDRYSGLLCLWLSSFDASPRNGFAVRTYQG